MHRKIQPCRREARALCPECPIQSAILDRLGDVLGMDWNAAVQVCHGARHFEDAIMGPRAESLLSHRPLQQTLAIWGESTISANLPRRHLRVAINPLRRGGKALQL